jgi:hypothetical protein
MPPSGGGRGYRRKRQYFKSGLGDQDRVFPLRRQAAILGDDGPAIGQLADGGLAGIDHRLDGEDHSRLQVRPGVRACRNEHLRVFVEFVPMP